MHWGHEFNGAPVISRASGHQFKEALVHQCKGAMAFKGPRVRSRTWATISIQPGCTQTDPGVQ